MKKIAVISDIHANWLALESILKNENFKTCDCTFFCGDAIGYYYDAENVVDYLRNSVQESVLGNHDQIFITQYSQLNGSTSEYESKYGFGLKVASETLSAVNIGWLKALPSKKEVDCYGKKFLLCHGAPWDAEQYIYPDSNEETTKRLFSENCDIILVGHSHYQFQLHQNNKFVINPGSIGQARKKGGLAEWATIEIKNSFIDVQFFQTPYVVNSLIEQIDRFNPNIPYLKNVLVR